MHKPKLSAVRRKVNKAIQLAVKRDKTAYSATDCQFKHSIRVQIVRG